MTYQSEVLADSPLAYWRLDDAPAVAVDAAGGTSWPFSAGVTGSQSPLLSDGGFSVHGNGTNPIATISSVPTALNGANVTLEAWVSIPSTNVKGSFVKVGSSANGWGMGVGNTQWDNTGRKLILLSEAVAWHPTTYSFPAGAGTYHVMVVRGASGAVTAYVNGTSVWTGTLSSPITASGQMGVGGYTEGIGFKLSSTVNIDNVAMFASALSATRVSEHYNSGAGDNAELSADSPTVWLKLDDTSVTSPTTFADGSGNSRPSTIFGTPTLGATAATTFIGGTSVTFATGNYGSVATPAWASALGALSVEAWFKTTASANQAILTMDNTANSPGATTRKFALYLDSAGKLTWMAFTSAGGFPFAATAGAYNDGNWHHVVATRSTTGMTVYVDGASVATQTISGTLSGTNAVDMLLGAISAGAGTGYPFTGTLDEVAIYSGELSSTRVSAHYAAGTTAGSIAVPALGVVLDALNPAVTVAAPALALALNALDPTLLLPSVTAPVLGLTLDALNPAIPVAAPTFSLGLDLLSPFVIGSDIDAPTLGLSINMLDPLVVTPISMEFLVESSFDITSLLDVTPISMEFLVGTSFQAIIPRGDNPDPRTGRVQWRYVVTDRDGNRYGQLDKVTADPIEDGVNVTGETAFTIATSDPKHALIQPVERECQVWRGRHLMHKGPILPGRPSDDGSMVTYAVPDARWYLSDDRRVIGRVPKRNLLKNGDFRQGLTYWRGGFETGTIPALPPLVEVVESDISVSGKALRVTGADKSQLTIEDVKTGAVFVPNESTYLSGGEAVIQAVGTNVPDDSDVHIVGHTANNSINGDFGDGMALSLARANAAKATLLAQNATLNITTEGKGFYQPVATNSTEAGQALNRRVVISYEGTQSATGSAQYEYQKVTVSNPTTNGRPLTMTVSGWRELTNWIGPNVHEYGVYIQLVKASAQTVVVDSAYSTLNEDSTLDSPQRDSATVEVPANGLDYIVEVRFYAPNGTILWTRCELTPGDMLPFPNKDQALIVKGIIEHIQDTSKGKGDLGIGTRTPLTGVKRNRWYYEYERMHADQALGEFPALYRGLDIDLLPSAAGGDTVATYFPQQGGTSAMVLGPNVVVRFTPANSRDVASSIIAQADGSGADRDEAYASDASALGGLLLERVVSAENETPVNELDEAAVAELGRAKVTTPAYWVECHPKHTNALLDAIGKGDRVRVILRDGYTNVDATARVVKRRLDPNSDSVSFMVELEV